MTKRALVAAVFLTGCALGGVSSQLVVPKANAQQAATLTKWEYACLNSLADRTKLNQFGDQGWELTAGAQGIWCFKRQKM